MKHILAGNAALALCSAFYLAWWILAFKPAGAVKGFKTDWLLIPAVAFGGAALLLIFMGTSTVSSEDTLFPQAWIGGTGAIVFVLLLIGTWVFMKRPVTAELFLIAGWATLAIYEVSALKGMGVYSKTGALVFSFCVIVMMIVSLICYLLYYKLDSVKGWYDGMIPLIFVLLTAIATDLTML